MELEACFERKREEAGEVRRGVWRIKEMGSEREMIVKYYTIFTRWRLLIERNDIKNKLSKKNDEIDIKYDKPNMIDLCICRSTLVVTL